METQQAVATIAPAAIGHRTQAMAARSSDIMTAKVVERTLPRGTPHTAREDADKPTCKEQVGMASITASQQTNTMTQNN